MLGLVHAPRTKVALSRLLFSCVALLFSVTGTSACLLRPDVTRVVDGYERSGRYIRPDAYALYMQGVMAERSGDLAVAERYYLAAHERDREAVAVLARLGAVRCAWGPRGFGPAERTFDEAQEVEPDYAPLHLERGRCALNRGALPEAERGARRALALSPYDLETSFFLAVVLEARGDAEQAARVLDGLAWSTGSERAWREVERLARRRGDRERVLVASRHSGRDPEEQANVEGIDAALARGDLEAAQGLAAEAGVPLGHVAVRAAALGRWWIARNQAKRVLAADPSQADALAAWLAAPVPQSAFDAVDPVIWRRLLRREKRVGGLSSLGVLVLADGLRRRFGMDLARAWLLACRSSGVWSGDPTGDEDPLVRSLQERLGVTPAAELPEGGT